MLIQSIICMSYNSIINSYHFNRIISWINDMRHCVICNTIFQNYGKEICCSKKCKILEGIKKEDNGCWIYKRSSSGPYGKVRWKMRWYSAHRTSYEEFVGEIKKGLWVCHKCDTPKCVNPEHLFLGSAKDNRRDSINKKRSIVFLGENNQFAKFTNIQVEELRKLKNEGFTYERLSRIFNCSFTYLVKLFNNSLRN